NLVKWALHRCADLLDLPEYVIPTEALRHADRISKGRDEFVTWFANGYATEELSDGIQSKLASSRPSGVAIPSFRYSSNTCSSDGNGLGRSTSCGFIISLLPS